MQTDDSKLSKLDHSSENELEQGILFYDEIEKGNKYTKYSYFDSFRKEIDGIYYQHSGINLGIGKKELNLDNYKKYEDFENEYDTGEKNNDLHGYIIMKNFKETAIPKNTPFIIEIKAGFDLITLLKQIKKAAKYVNNMKNCKCHLPEYFIGILCSFNKYNVTRNINELNNLYNGSDSEDYNSGIKLFKHITKIIEKNKIKFVLAVIKDGKINGYDLGKEDYDIDFADKNYQRVDLLYMYKTISNIQKPEDLEIINEKIKNVADNFSKVYQTFNRVKAIEIPYTEIIEKDNIIKELEEKIKIIEERKKMEEIMKKKREELMKKMEEELIKQMEEERKKMEEEIMRNMEEEIMRKIKEERKKMEEELIK